MNTDNTWVFVTEIEGMRENIWRRNEDGRLLYRSFGRWFTVYPGEPAVAVPDTGDDRERTAMATVDLVWPSDLNGAQAGGDGGGGEAVGVGRGAGGVEVVSEAERWAALIARIASLERAVESAQRHIEDLQDRIEDLTARLP